ncbi:YheU family protein [Thalassomonas actiniarum]|uniref:YheU family protein n=1 Tax=Thalassomonas actiniarum TaxID=485447 RepID=A0AAE9YSQ5_9GAMM|nr:YheU family protein [Thalassomonas actiniarum]WDD98876.1 YheU family protein [Thalassomonas actiniarum]
MIIPPDKLSPEVLAAVIEEFVLREGTEYGAADIDLSTKIAQVKQQLADGSALLVYSELYESVNIMPADQFNAGTHE